MRLVYTYENIVAIQEVLQDPNGTASQLHRLMRVLDLQLEVITRKSQLDQDELSVPGRMINQVRAQLRKAW